MTEPAVRFSHISMQFPGVLANDDVSLDIREGEIFALVGENGAGKTTLMNLLYGIYTPTAGTLWVRGKKVERFDPKEAIARGVGMVHQHFMLVPSFTVAQNIVIRREPRKLGLFYDERAAVAQTEALCAEYGLQVDPNATVESLSVGMQQRVEILKALHRGAEILILDEPTAVLTPQETEELFTVLRRIVKERSMTVILITHKLPEVLSISDRVGVMRKGKLVAVRQTAEMDRRSLASLMVGREMLYGELPGGSAPGAALLEVRDLHVCSDRGQEAVRGLSLTVHAGEVLGIAAVEGNGQSELIEAITGLRRVQAGEITVCGKSVANSSPGEIRAAGLAHVPEDRLKTGLSAEASVAENLLVGRQNEPRFRKALGWLSGTSVGRYAQELYDKFDVRGAGIEAKAGDMSGGNMQKVVIAREFTFDTPVLVIAQPTRGVDVGAIEFIHGLIAEKRAEGAAILLSSADLDEVLRLSDRIVTLYEGCISGEFSGDAIDATELGYHMTGRGEAPHEA